MTVVAAHARGEVVELELEDGSVAELHRFALRDGCVCSQCSHPVSGQRLFESSRVVPDAWPMDVEVSAEGLTVTWQDSHLSVYPRGWLAVEIAALRVGGRVPRAQTLWDATLDLRSTRFSYDEVITDRAARRRWLAAIAELGFAVVTGAPIADGTVAKVAELFAHVRVTNYGRVFDVTVKVDATNLADTAMPLGLHTDNPYRDPAPTLQLLQCLSSSVSGGETVLADGFNAIVELAARSPRRLELLARQPVRHAYSDSSTDLWSDVPVIALDAAGVPTALHINNRSKRVPVGAPSLVAAWYEAYFQLLMLLESPDAQISFRLEPGDVVAFDNLRVLHARRGFSGGGQRRLQGCYADRDGLYASLALLDRAGAAWQA
jgi:gamma-butyrobetaine dioxygenase